MAMADVGKLHIEDGGHAEIEAPIAASDCASAKAKVKLSDDTDCECLDCAVLGSLGTALTQLASEKKEKIKKNCQYPPSFLQENTALRRQTTSPRH